MSKNTNTNTNTNDLDTNINNYTIPEMLSILGLGNNPTDEDITNTTNTFINQAKKSGNTDISNFFQDMQTTLLSYNNEGNDGDENDDVNADDNGQAEEWYQNEALEQSDSVQKDKITNRRQKVDIYDNQHVPMNREQLGVSNNFQVPVSQDTLNPNLKNVTSRFIVLDSQFRQATGGIDTISTDYTLDLSDPLTDALSLRLYSIQIPFTWYIIDTIYGNTCFWITIPYNTINNLYYEIKVSFTPGNYTYTSFQTEFAAAIDRAGITNPGGGATPLIFINQNSAKVIINLDGWVYTDPDTSAVIPITGITENTDVFDPTLNPFFVFFDFGGRLNCLTNGSGCAAPNMTFNGTLGWIMGFRLPIIPIFKSPGNSATSIINLQGPKYFIIVLDDYNQNHINNGLISIAELSTKLPIPSYYNTSQPSICIPNVSNPFSNASGLDALSLGLNPNSDKLDASYGQRQVVLPSAPRTLTQAQLYTINEIIKNREKNTSFRGKAPTNSDTFAIIPIKRSSMNTGDIYTDFSGSLQDNSRIYFGPVNVDRMRVKLVDDRGYTVNLNGAEWCFTIVAESLYQY
jgi:hypothetical protein